MSELGGHDGWCEYRTSKFYHIVVDVHKPFNPYDRIAVTLCGRHVHENPLLPGTQSAKITVGIPVTKRQLCPQCAERL